MAIAILSFNVLYYDTLFSYLIFFYFILSDSIRSYDIPFYLILSIPSSTIFQYYINTYGQT